MSGGSRGVSRAVTTLLTRLQERQQQQRASKRSHRAAARRGARGGVVSGGRHFGGDRPRAALILWILPHAIRVSVGSNDAEQQQRHVVAVLLLVRLDTEPVTGELGGLFREC